MKKKGNESNRRGQGFENQVAAALDSRGFLYARQYHIGHSIFGAQYKVYADFLVRGVPGYEAGLAIECKWQDVGGSAYEKIPYTVLNIQQTYAYPAIIVMEGKYHKRVEPWLRGQVGKALVGVYWFGEFLSWINKQQPSGYTAPGMASQEPLFAYAEMNSLGQKAAT